MMALKYQIVPRIHVTMGTYPPGITSGIYSFALLEVKKVKE
jgi:hypothetical protein